MDSSVDGEEGAEVAAGLERRWADAGRLLRQIAPAMFASMVAAAEVTAVELMELSTVKSKNNG